MIERELSANSWDQGWRVEECSTSCEPSPGSCTSLTDSTGCFSNELDEFRLESVASAHLLRSSILEWFEARGIKQGNPEDLLQKQESTVRAKLALKYKANYCESPNTPTSHSCLTKLFKPPSLKLKL